jgi:hypothetical protein
MWCRVVVAFALFAACLPQAQAGNDRVWVLGTKTQLFVDDVLIDKMEHVARTLQNPSRIGDTAILKPEQPWEGSLAMQPGTVIFDEDEGLLKMWYNSLPVDGKPDIEEFLCYATSKDGIHWTKPVLNEVAYRGSTANNIFLKWCSWNLSVIKDSHETDPSKRYKLAFWNWHDKGREGVWVAFSADGTHWQLLPNNPVVPSAASSDTFCVMQDPASHQFWMYHKSPFYPVRKVSRLVSSDFVHWRDDELVLEPDDYDPPDTEFYGLSPFAYADQYLGLLWVFHTYTEQIDIQLVSSRDGLKWDRSVHRRVFFPLGYVKLGYDGNAFDSKMIMAIAPPVARDGQLWLYYTGFNVKHNARMGSFMDTYADAVGQIGAARLPVDGFCSLDATSEGTVVTRPLRFRGSVLRVTAATGSLRNRDQKIDPVWTGLFSHVEDGEGQVAVEVLDEAGRPIPGYSAAACAAVRGTLDTRTVTWERHQDLGELRAQTIRLKFVLRNARLFSFKIE